MNRSNARNLLAEFDWLLFVALAGLMIVGALFIYSATLVTAATASAPFYAQPSFRQLVFWYCAGLVVGWLACTVRSPPSPPPNSPTPFRAQPVWILQREGKHRGYNSTHISPAARRP